MSKKTLDIVLSIFAVYATLQVTKDMSITHNWLLTEIIRLIICAIVVVIVTTILNLIFKNKSS